jgi:SAM-dependent methyltransferase
VPEPLPRVDPEWYCRAFGGDYPRRYRARDARAAEREAEFARRALELRPGERVLDLACGAGRHLAPLAAAGLRVVGLDRSRPLLAAARSALGPAVPLLIGDMRRLPLAPVFRAVLSFFTSFGYFQDEAEDARVIAEWARVTLPGGGLLLDLPDRKATIASLVPASVRAEDGLEIAERRWISADGRRVEKEIRLRRSSATSAMSTAPGACEGAEEERFCESVRLYEHDEIEGALAAKGWREVSVHADFSGAPWRPGAGPRMIVVARREGMR